MEARVVVVHPADQPHRDVVVAAQLLVVARVRRVLHEVLPHGGIGGQVTDEGLQGGGVEFAHRIRSGLATVRAWMTASPERRERDRLDHGHVGPVEQPVDADDAQHRVDRPRAVGGGVEERQGVVHGLDRAAAGGEALGVQRREAGEHGEDDPQRRVPRRGRTPPTSATPRASRPRRRSARETTRASRRPARDGRTAARRAPPGAPAPARRGRQRPAGHGHADRARVEQGVDVAAARPTARTARPARARPTWNASSRSGWSSMPIGSEAAIRIAVEVRPRRGIMVGGVERRRRVARQLQVAVRATGVGPSAAPTRRAGPRATGAGERRRGARSVTQYRQNRSTFKELCVGPSPRSP